MEFKLPDIGEGVVEGEIVQWLVKEGDIVKEDQPLVEVMTDKATVEITCPKSGVISKILAKEGEVVPVESVIVIFGDGNESKSENKDFVLKGEPQTKSFVIQQDSENDFSKTKRKVLATPATRKFARENNVDISKVSGSGPNGRVTKQDITDYISGNKGFSNLPETKELVVASEVTSYSSYSSETKNNEERIPFRGLRKKISENLKRSKQNAPHFMLADEVDMTELVNFRRDCKPFAEKRDIKLTYLPFIVKAVVSALKDFPTLNSVLDEEKNELILKKYYNIGVAVATSQGLVVPVVKNSESKSIFSLASEIEGLAERTRNGKVNVEELKGGTFTITNIGSIGGLFSSPIINYPEVAILAVNKILEKPVIKDGQIVARSMMYLSLSCDHRIVDGAIAALFLNKVIELLENPKALLLD